jgi:hypothetical protein
LPISEKSSKIKFLEKFQKILYKFLCQKWDREAPGRHQEGLPRHHTHRGRGPALAAPTCCEGAPPGLSLISSSLALRYVPEASKPVKDGDLKLPRVHAVVALDERVAQVVDGESLELRELAEIEFQIVRVSCKTENINQQFNTTNDRAK